MRGRYAISITTNGLNWRADDIRAAWSRGAPVVFHHGIGTDLGIWSDWLPVLGPDHLLVRFDLRGFGRSTVPAGHVWSLGGLVDDYFAVADAAGVERFHAVGASIGGTVVLAAALRAPDRILSVTVSNGAHKGAGLGRVKGWRQAMADKGLDRWADEMLDQRFDEAAVPAEVRQWFDATQRRSDAEVIVALGELLLGVDLSPRLAELRPPLLILAPQQSPFIPAETFEAMHAAVRGARIHRFDSARHGLPLSHGRGSAELARDFIAEKVETT